MRRIGSVPGEVAAEEGEVSPKSSRGFADKEHADDIEGSKWGEE
jgi:hypothetical protein